MCYVFPANIHRQQTSLPRYLLCNEHAPIYAPQSFFLCTHSLSLWLSHSCAFFLIFLNFVCAIRMYHVIYRIQCDLINVLMTNLFEWIYVSRFFAYSIHSVPSLHYYDDCCCYYFAFLGCHLGGVNPSRSIEHNRKKEQVNECQNDVSIVSVSMRI